MRLWAGLSLLLFVCVLHAHDGHDHAVPLMVSTAKNFLASLTPEQREKALMPFDGDERFFWHYIPSDDIPGRFQRPRMGLILADMTPHQKHLASALLSAGLSQQGFIKTTTIMSLEDVLRILERTRRAAAIRKIPLQHLRRADGDRRGLRGRPPCEPAFHRGEGKATGNPTFLGSNRRRCAAAQGCACWARRRTRGAR